MPEFDITLWVGPEAAVIALADPQAQLLEEIADRSMRRADVMSTYALAIRQKSDIEWPVVNAAIIARWSMSSLDWVKREAWKKVMSGAEAGDPCGTIAGYGYHVRRGTKPCQPCRDAQSARMRKRRQQGYKAPAIPADVLAQRLLAKSVVVDGGCRRWTGWHEHKGYGQVSVGPRLRPVHVVAYEIWVGPIPEGCEVDHVYANGCRYRDCIEAAHLEAVTHAENIRRANEARKARKAVAS